MAPYHHSQSVPRDTVSDGVGGSSSNGISPLFIVGFAFAGTIIIGLCAWLGIYTYRKRKRSKGDALTIQGVISESDEKATRPRIPVTGQPDYFSRDQLTASIVMPHQNIIRSDVTKDEIFRYHMASGTMTRPFSVSSTLAPPSPKGTTSRPISIVSFRSGGAAGGGISPRRTSFFSFGNRPSSMASTCSAASTMFGVEGRKVRQLFNPVLPDELVLSLSERVTVVKSFDDGWCIVGRDSFIKPGEVEMGAVPAWCFVKPVKGLKASRPMRTSSLGVTVEVDAGAGFSSRDEVISWSNF
ncbi:hypothetical protein BJV74DRAFT_501634 [Russula compacta]|nr:hypothetical protein BJV74DRAFT_501634 [Russula compacta]